VVGYTINMKQHYDNQHCYCIVINWRIGKRKRC